MTTLQNRLQVQQFSERDQQDLLNGSLRASSLRLAKCSIKAIDTTIASILEELCRIEGADHAGWFADHEGSPSVALFTPAAARGGLAKLRGLNRQELPWCRSQLTAGRAVLLSDLTELPSQAKIDRNYLESLGLRSLAMIPVESGDLSSGVVAVWSKKRACRWSSSLQQHCSLMGSVFLGAHARRLTGLEREDSDTHFREIFRNASAGMALEDTSGRMLFVNEALCRMFGFSEQEMMRMSCKDISHPADGEREAALFKRLLSGEHHSYQMEKRFLHRNGATVWGKLNVTLLREYSNSSHVVLGVVEDITDQKVALEKLNISQKEVQSLASRLILSQEEERQRIARELHDDIGQRLSLVTSEMHVFKQWLSENDRAQLASIEDLSNTLDTLVSDVHGLSHRLHSSKLQHLGIASALRDLCAQITRSGLRVEIGLDEELEPVPKEVSLCLYRVAQEALTNALKHSGANHTAITLQKTAEEYYMAIKDDGKGFDMNVPVQGLGLISMRERLMSLQGHFSLLSSPGHGTRIMVKIPREDPSALDERETARQSSGARSENARASDRLKLLRLQTRRSL